MTIITKANWFSKPIDQAESIITSHNGGAWFTWSFYYDNNHHTGAVCESCGSTLYSYEYNKSTHLLSITINI